MDQRRETLLLQHYHSLTTMQSALVQTHRLLTAHQNEILSQYQGEESKSLSYTWTQALQDLNHLRTRCERLQKQIYSLLHP